jgi:carboxyl-terminal processing protease
MPDDKRFQTTSKPSETEGKWLQEGKVAHIRIPSFMRPRFEEKALEFVELYSRAQAIILDVRGNGGGSTPSRLIKRVMNQPYRWWAERSRRPEPLRKRHRNGEIRFASDYSYAEWQPDWTEPECTGGRYEGKIILLTDRHTGSAAEDFTMPFKDNGRATIIGEKTWGSTGQPVFRNFGDDIRVGIGSIRAYFPTGEPFEGIGIAPDISVECAREDVYSKWDAVMEKALECV